MSTKIEDTKIEDAGVASGRLTKRQKLGRNCRRFWWAWLIGTLLIILAIILAMIYGIVPAVAQSKINATALTLHALNITNPTSDSFVVSINGTITGATGTAKHARLDEFPVNVHLADRPENPPIMKLTVPPVHGGDNIPVIQKDQAIEIENVEPLDEFALKLMEEEEIEVAMDGRVKVWLGKLHPTVDYHEVVKLKALNKLKGMVITAYSIVDGDDNKNVVGDVLIPNPSIVTIQMGDVGLNIGLGGDSLGTGVIRGLILRPGNHTYKFETKIIEDKLLSVASAAIKGESLTISSPGTTINGNRVEWLSKPLMKLATLVPINTHYFDNKSE